MTGVPCIRGFLCGPKTIQPKPILTQSLYLLLTLTQSINIMYQHINLIYFDWSFIARPKWIFSTLAWIKPQLTSTLFYFPFPAPQGFPIPNNAVPHLFVNIAFWYKYVYESIWSSVTKLTLVKQQVFLFWRKWNLFCIFSQSHKVKALEYN
jgi:hypothetical protein